MKGTRGKGNGGRGRDGTDSRLDRRDLDRYIMHGSGHLCPCPSCATFLSLAEYAFFSNKPTLPAPDLSTSANHCCAEISLVTLLNDFSLVLDEHHLGWFAHKL